MVDSTTKYNQETLEAIFAFAYMAINAGNAVMSYDRRKSTDELFNNDIKEISILSDSSYPQNPDIGTLVRVAYSIPALEQTAKKDCPLYDDSEKEADAQKHMEKNQISPDEIVKKLHDCTKRMINAIKQYEAKDSPIKDYQQIQQLNQAIKKYNFNSLEP